MRTEFSVRTDLSLIRGYGIGLIVAFSVGLALAFGGVASEKWNVEVGLFGSSHDPLPEDRALDNKR